MNAQRKGNYELIESHLICEVYAVEFARQEVNFQSDTAYREYTDKLKNKSIDYLESYLYMLDQLFDGFVNALNFNEVVGVYEKAVEQTKAALCGRFKDITPELVDKGAKRYYKRMKKEYKKLFSTVIKYAITNNRSSIAA